MMTESTAVQTIQPDWALSSRVRVESSTRHGGVSEAPYTGLNLGLHVGDDEAHVRQNRALLHTHLNLPSEPVWLKQVHGVEVCRLENMPASASTQTADASWTNQPNTVLAIMTADCLPVVIANERETAIAVAHAGWRGLADGVLTKTLAQFASGDKLHAWMGPAIGPTAFEVGEEVHAAFVKKHQRNAAAFVSASTAGKYYADLYQLARIELENTDGITVTGGDHCTVSEPANFFSHRRDGARSGRMATLAWLA